MPRNYITGKFTPLVLDTHELAWAAGFFDGEGCTFIHNYTDNRHSPKLMFSISQVKPQVLVRFRKAVHNLAEIRGPFRNRKVQDIHRLDTSNFEKVQAIMAMLWKYLSDVKREQYKKNVKLYLQGQKDYINFDFSKFHRERLKSV